MSGADAAAAAASAAAAAAAAEAARFQSELAAEEARERTVRDFVTSHSTLRACMSGDQIATLARVCRLRTYREGQLVCRGANAQRPVAASTIVDALAGSVVRDDEGHLVVDASSPMVVSTPSRPSAKLNHASRLTRQRLSLARARLPMDPSYASWWPARAESSSTLRRHSCESDLRPRPLPALSRAAQHQTER